MPQPSRRLAPARSPGVSRILSCSGAGRLLVWADRPQAPRSNPPAGPCAGTPERRLMLDDCWPARELKSGINDVSAPRRNHRNSNQRQSLVAFAFADVVERHQLVLAGGDGMMSMVRWEQARLVPAECGARDVKALHMPSGSRTPKLQPKEPRKGSVARRTQSPDCRRPDRPAPSASGR